MIETKRILTHVDCINAAERLVGTVAKDLPLNPKIFGVPRGGIPVAYLVAEALARGGGKARIIANPEYADLMVDDIIDSGRTRDRYEAKYPRRPFTVTFQALADYLHPAKKKGEWIVFPWEEGDDGSDTSADDIVVRLLQRIGEDPAREGLRETPARVLKAWEEWTAGYRQKPEDVLKVFEDGGERYDEMVWQKDLPFYSSCEHHMAPFFGSVTIAYVPNKKIVGLSKLGRLTDIFARRLQVQERLTVQIADAIMEHLKPKGVGVLVEARHLCMESRGYNRQGQTTVSSALRGVFVEDKVRAEFLTIANK